MNHMPEPIDYYHLSGAMLEPRSIIHAGNWGRVITHLQWRHNEALREMALEDARRTRFPHRPSRLEAVFVFLTEQEAREFRSRNGGFNSHLLYRVTLIDPSALSFVTDSRLCGPVGTLRPNWADVYWTGGDPAQMGIPGISDWKAATGGIVQSREMLTLSNLRVEERLN